MTNLNIKNYFFLVLFGMLFLAIRYTTPLITPWIYAEDGVWVANALSHGWMDTFVNAREDYFVFFNIFFLFISTSISNILSGSPLLLLPQSIAVVSYLFYSLIAVMTFHTIIKIAHPVFAILAYFLTLLIPLGLSQSENFGHLLQIGFYMPMIAMVFILQRECVTSRIAKNGIDLLIWLTAATNPVVFLVVGGYYFFKLLITKEKVILVKDLIPLAIAMTVLAIFIIPRINGSGGLGNHSYDPNNIIEMSTARLILYPFLFPWYEKLNNTTSIVLTVLYFIFCITVICKTKNNTARKYLLTIAMVFLISLFTTIFGRIGLTDMLKNYQRTFPDRYFSGTNLLAILLFIACLAQCTFSKISTYLSYFLCASLLCIYISNIDRILQNGPSKRNIVFGDMFTYAICKAEKIDESNSAIKINPRGWVMKVPTTLISEIGCH